MPPLRTQSKKSAKIKILPKHEQYLDAFRRFQFLKPEHIQYAFGGSLNARTLRFDLVKLMTAGYLRRLRSNRDEEYTYFPSSIRERSPLMLTHTNEVTWAQILVASDAARKDLEMLACERRASHLKFSVAMQNDEGVIKRRCCVPDFFCAHKDPTKPTGRDTRHYFWEITNAKPGQHWKKENDIIQKCQMYNAYFNSGEFVHRLQKEFHLHVRNFRVIITFPTEARACNFTQIFRSRGVAYPGRFFVTWKDAYRANMWGPIFLSPKNDSLHSLSD
jgi:hypothetical protein